VVSKGSVPAILGFAVASGARSQAASGTQVSVRGNLVGWLDLIKNQGFIASYEDDAPFVRGLRRVSYSLTLNTDPNSDAAASPAGLGGFTPEAIRTQLKETQQQLAGYSIRFAIVDQRDPRTAANRAAVATQLEATEVGVLRADDFTKVLFNSREYNREWLPETAKLLNNLGLSEATMKAILYRQIEVMRRLALSRIDHFNERVGNALSALQAFDAARVRVFEAMQKRPLVAFEYVNARAPNLPERSTLRLVAEGQWGPRIDLTANGAVTLQHAGSTAGPSPVDLGGVRDVQVAAQLEVPLGNAQQRVASIGGIGTPVVGVAYLSEKLNDVGIVSFAGNSFTLEPGWIHVVQASLTIPVKGSGIKIPLSVSVANRSELIKEKTVRGHIGLTLDLDVLSALRR